MHWIDAGIFIVYMIALLGVGMWFMRKNASTDDYFVGGRPWVRYTSDSRWSQRTWVADSPSVLGGLGFVMGLSGSWMLFTGLVGAWLAAVFLIPKVYTHGT